MSARHREPRTHVGRERLGRVIWLLLFLNVLPFSGIPTVIPISTHLGQLVTQGALAAATVLVLVLNRRLLVRPNLLLTLVTLLGASSVVASMHMVSGIGTVFRTGRFCVFILVLWLLTPLWTRRDLLLRWHMIALMLALSTVVVGALVKPGGAFSPAEGRLQGELWPIPPTQVAHYAAVRLRRHVPAARRGFCPRSPSVVYRRVLVARSCCWHTRVPRRSQ